MCLLKTNLAISNIRNHYPGLKILKAKKSSREMNFKPMPKLMKEVGK